jgi:hypothetical protein
MKLPLKQNHFRITLTGIPMTRLLLLTIVLFAGCSLNRFETDYGGNGGFIILNKSSVLIRVETTKVTQLGGDCDTSAIIWPDSSKTLFSDAITGSNVTPQKSLSSINIYADSTGTMILLYFQNPIDESKWTIEKQYPGDFGHTRNTFEFHDSMIMRQNGR